MYRFLFAAALIAAVVPAGADGVDFSPDGLRLAIGTRAGIALFPADGGAHEVVPDGAGGSMPTWSPDGRFLLFCRQGALAVYDPEKKQTRSFGERYMPVFAWREDSRRFVAPRKREDDTLELVWYDWSAGGVAHRAPIDVEPAALVWLPETDDVALLAGQDIYTVEGGEIRRITTTSDVIGMALTPSKKELIWARRGANLRFQLLSLYQMDLKSRSVTRREFPMRVPGVNPAASTAPERILSAVFSPDGQRMAVITVHAEKTPERKYAACFIVPMDGAGAKLVRRSQRSDGTPGALLTVWSRDGRRLAVQDTLDAERATNVFESDGANPRRILTEPG